jgi:hypothetical protein
MISSEDLEEIMQDIREQCVVDLIKDTDKYSEWQKGKLAGKIELIYELIDILEDRLSK